MSPEVAHTNDCQRASACLLSRISRNEWSAAETTRMVRDGHHEAKWTALSAGTRALLHRWSSRRTECPASLRLFSPCSAACTCKGKPSHSWPRPRDRLGLAIRRSAVCRSVLPIPESCPTPAASEMHQVCRRSARTRQYPWSPRHHRHRHASWRHLIIRARHSGSSARTVSSRRVRHRLAGDVVRRSLPSRGFAEGVRNVATYVDKISIGLHIPASALLLADRLIAW